MLEVARAENAGTAADPAALIDDADAAAAVRRVSPIGLAPRRGRDEDVIAPMMPAPFINPAVIHRTRFSAPHVDGRPAVAFRYREGIAIGGGRATLPLRWGAAGRWPPRRSDCARFARASPGRPAPARAGARGASRRPPASGRRRTGSRAGAGA